MKGSSILMAAALLGAAVAVRASSEQEQLEALPNGIGRDPLRGEE